jgi:hypothetical protein
LHRTLIAAIAAAVALITAGCSSEQVYGAAQTWQRNECYKINDAAERQRCLASNSRSYDDYQRQAEAARRAASSSTPAARPASAP